MFPDVQIRKILYATDLSEYARKAFAYAVSLADHYNAGITILHTVIDNDDIQSHVLGYIGKDKWEKILKEQMDGAREILIGKKREKVPLQVKEALAQFCEDAKDKFENKNFITDEIIVSKGDPAEEIVKCAQTCGCDLIVMGSHGHGGFIDAMIGSVSRNVLRHSKKPVFMVRMED